MNALASTFRNMGSARSAEIASRETPGGRRTRFFVAHTKSCQRLQTCAAVRRSSPNNSAKICVCAALLILPGRTASAADFAAVASALKKQGFYVESLAKDGAMSALEVVFSLLHRPANGSPLCK